MKTRVRWSCGASAASPYSQHLGERDVMWDWIYRLDGSCGEDISTLRRTKNRALLDDHPWKGDSAPHLICGSHIKCKPYFCSAQQSASWNPALRGRERERCDFDRGEQWSRMDGPADFALERRHCRCQPGCLSFYPRFLHLTLLILRCLTFSQPPRRRLGFSDTHSSRIKTDVNGCVVAFIFFTQHIFVISHWTMKII